MENVLYTINDAATFFSVSPQTIRVWIRSGMISSIKTPSGRTRIPKSEIERFLPRSAAKEPIANRKMSEATRKTLQKFGIVK